ncbi:MAG: hypothetical protein AAGG48_00130 [Planctomycetota bacterium]
MGYVILTVMVGGTFAVGWWLRQINRSLNDLRNRCRKQLSDLLEHIEQRHLILSHLQDQLGDSEDVDRSRIQRASDRTQKAVDRVNSAAPKPADLTRLADRLRESFVATDEIVERYDKSKTNLSDSFVGCLEGTKASSRQIVESIATYNSSVITYRVYVNSTTAISRRIHTIAEYRELDINPTHSSDSANAPPLRTA